MPLTFTKKAAGAATSNETQKPASALSEQAAADKPSTTGKITFLKKGAAAKAAVAQEEAKAEARRSEWNRPRRYKIGFNEDGQITFLDGKLDEDGMLDIPRYYEHTIQVGSDWKHYVCTADSDQSQPCPICEAGDKPALVGLLTVIDHSCTR